MRKFKVGEEVTVRTWEDMKKQYDVKNFAPELPKDSFFGSFMNEMLSMEIILAPNKAIFDAMKPFCGRKMRISANPEPNIYKLEGQNFSNGQQKHLKNFGKRKKNRKARKQKRNRNARICRSWKTVWWLN